MTQEAHIGLNLKLLVLQDVITRTWVLRNNIVHL